jgi:NAD(P)H-dependent flavin oxidoreductase YrpB (nitropropane dioxygenase family)
MTDSLVLGAEGINIGVRFCAKVEAPIHDRIKQALVGANESQTKLNFRALHNAGHVLSNAVSQEVVAMERRPGGRPDRRRPGL